MVQITLVEEGIKELSSTRLDDFVDRRHYLTTSLVFAFFAVVIASQQFFKDPIQCLSPAEFPDSWNSYVRDFCYSHPTFHTHNGSDYDVGRKKIYVSNYVWIPIILVLQATSFVLPHFIHLFLAKCQGMNYQAVVNRCIEASKKDSAEMEKEVKAAAQVVLCSYNRSRRASITMGNSMAISYLVTKFLAILNIIVQVWFMSFFTGMPYTHPLEVIGGLFETGEWSDSREYFPRVTFCDFEMKKLGNLQQKTVQCLLTLNVINEKIYLVLFLWLYVLLALSVVNLLYETFRLSSTRFSAYFRSTLKGDDPVLREFRSDFLAKNGLLLASFVAHHAGYLTSALFLNSLLDLYRQDHKHFTNTGRHLSISDLLEEDSNKTKEDAKRGDKRSNGSTKGEGAPMLYRRNTITDAMSCRSMYSVDLPPDQKRESHC